MPGPAHYGEFAQIENGIGSITQLRMRVAQGISELMPIPGTKIGVVTGKAMGNLLPPLIEQIVAATGAEIEVIEMSNSLFGPTITTAGLLVGADIRKALESRSDLDFALIPAETINESGVFLDDVVFETLRNELPIPVYPSYDFIDVLAAGSCAVAA